jgi:hypothetical protein
MTIRDFFRAGSIRRENEDLASRLRSMEAECDRLRARLGEAAVMNLVTLREATDRARREGADAQANAAARQADLVAVEAELGEKRARIVETNGKRRPGTLHTSD